MKDVSVEYGLKRGRKQYSFNKFLIKEEEINQCKQREIMGVPIEKYIEAQIKGHSIFYRRFNDLDHEYQYYILILQK